MQSKFSSRLAAHVKVASDTELLALKFVVAPNLTAEQIQGLISKIESVAKTNVHYIPISQTLHCRATADVVTLLESIEGTESIDIESSASINELLD